MPLNTADHSLLKNLIESNGKTSSELYNKFFPKVLKYINIHDGDLQNAQDIFQSAIVLLILQARKKDFEIKSTLEGYFFTICKNLWRKELNSKKKWVRNDTVIALKGEGVEHSKIVEIIRVRNIDSFSANEELLIKQENLSQHDKVNSAWRYESLYALLWAVNIIDELKYPNEICDVKNVVSSVMNKSRDDFDRMVNLRTKEEILDKLDLIYRMNWACVDARIKNTDVSGSLNSSVLYGIHSTNYTLSPGIN